MFKGPLLAAQMIEAMKHPELSIRDWKNYTKGLGPQPKIGLKRFRDGLESAQKIVLDNDFVEIAVLASIMEPSMLLKLMPRIRLPFPHIWVEWDEQFRLSCLRKTYVMTDGIEHPEQQASRMGYAFREYEKDNAALFEMMGVFGFEHKKPIITEVMAMIDVESTDFSDIEDPGDYTATEAHMTIVSAFGQQYVKHWLPNTPEELKFRYWKEHYPEGYAIFTMMRHMRMKLNGVTGIKVASEIMKMPKEEGLEFLRKAMDNINGDIRFLLAVLILWNTIEVSVNDGPRAPFSAPKGLKQPYEVTHKVLKIDLPKEKAIEYLRHDMHTGRRHRAHDVMGHWCHSKKHPGKRWWRKSHTRGDATLGYVIKDYEVVANPDFSKRVKG